MADTRRHNGASLASSASLWASSSASSAPLLKQHSGILRNQQQKQKSTTHHTLATEPDHQLQPQQQQEQEQGKEEIIPSGLSAGTAVMSLTSAAAAVKERHTFQHQESHRQLGAGVPPSSITGEGGALGIPGSTPSVPTAGGGGAAPNSIVRVDSKDRWKVDTGGGWYGVLQGVGRGMTSHGGGAGGGARERVSPPAVGRGGGGGGVGGSSASSGFGHSGVGGGAGVMATNQALLSGMAYCISSCSMILLNKMVLSGYLWKAQISLMLYQNLVSVTIVLLLSSFGVIQVEPLTWRLVVVWMPVNFIFVGMLITSFFSLQYMQVAMVTILKNVTNLLTAVGEMYLFQKSHTLRVWGSLFLMIISAVCGGITDLSFHPRGYAWQGFNCLFTAAYSLTLRKVMDVAKAATKSGTLSEFSMVLLNNALSFPPAIVMIYFLGEMDFILKSPLMLDTGFWIICTVSGLLGLAISFTSMWFLHQTSPTTYSLVGSLNKIPLSILGIIMFNAPTSVANISSILFGCFAGVVFARAKMAG